MRGGEEGPYHLALSISVELAGMEPSHLPDAPRWGGGGPIEGRCAW
jgi:hypothetical protein